MKRKIILTVSQVTDPALNSALNKIAIMRLPNVVDNWYLSQLMSFCEDQSKVFTRARQNTMQKYGSPHLILTEEQEAKFEQSRKQLGDLSKTPEGHEELLKLRQTLGGKPNPNGFYQFSDEGLTQYKKEIAVLCEVEVASPLREPINIPLALFEALPPDQKFMAVEFLAIRGLIVIPEFAVEDDQVEPVVVSRPTVAEQIESGEFQMTFHNEKGVLLGVLNFEGEKITFKGNADESAMTFINSVIAYRSRMVFLDSTVESTQAPVVETEQHVTTATQPEPEKTDISTES